MIPIRLGIVGLGRGFVLTLPALRAHPGVSLAGAFDPRTDAKRAFTAEFDAPAHDTLEALLGQPDLDAVYIASPHEFHADQAIAALGAGLHVLVEKPMATSVRESRAMVEAAERTGRFLIVGPSHGFDEPVKKAADMVASGRFGSIRLVTALNFTDFMYRPRRPEELDGSRGGGVVYSQAAHQIDVVRRIVGQPTRSIRATVANWDARRPSEGAYTAMMGFAGGATATLTYSGYAHFDSDALVGWISELGQPKDPARYGDARRLLATLGEGEQAAKTARAYGAPGVAAYAPAGHHEHFGFILVSCDHADLKVLPTGIEVYGDSERSFVPLPPPVIPRAAVVGELIDAVTGAAPPLHDGRWGLETTACCAAILRSSRIGADVDPQSMMTDQPERGAE